MESTSTLEQKEKLSQEELYNLRDLNEKTLADYYQKKLKYYDFSHIVKNILE